MTKPSSFAGAGIVGIILLFNVHNFAISNPHSLICAQMEGKYNDALKQTIIQMGKLKSDHDGQLNAELQSFIALLKKGPTPNELKVLNSYFRNRKFFNKAISQVRRNLVIAESNFDSLKKMNCPLAVK